MNGYSVAIAASAKRELRDLPAETVGRIVLKMRELAMTPRPSGCKKLQGFTNRWRIRVGQYRVVYSVDDLRKTIDVTRIAHRRDVYSS